MSRRQPRPGDPAQTPPEAQATRSRPLPKLAAQAALLLAVFAAAAGLAHLAGAANAGTAMGIGQVAFTIVLIWLLLRR